MNGDPVPAPTGRLLFWLSAQDRELILEQTINTLRTTPMGDPHAETYTTVITELGVAPARDVFAGSTRNVALSKSHGDAAADMKPVYLSTVERDVLLNSLTLPDYVQERLR